MKRYLLVSEAAARFARDEITEVQREADAVAVKSGETVYVYEFKSEHASGAKPAPEPVSEPAPELVAEPVVDEPPAPTSKGKGKK